MNDMAPKTRLAERIQFVLKFSEKMSSIRDIAESLDIHRDKVTRYLRGEGKPPHADDLVKIVKYTGCSASWLLLGEGDPYDNSGGIASNNNSMTLAIAELREKVALQTTRAEYWHAQARSLIESMKDGKADETLDIQG